MSVIDLPTAASAHAHAWTTTTVHRAQLSLERGLVRYDAWFLVFTAVVIGLGATILAGMAVWCVVKKGKHFTGNWSFKNFGLKVNIQCV